MARLIPLLTLIPTIFTLISIILINIGGVSPNSSNSKYYISSERNTQFSLLKWNYTITPVQTYDDYNYHLYLNRLCTGSRTVNNESSYASVTSTGCVNRGKILRDADDLYAPNALVADIAPFRFESVNLKVPFAFYISTAVLALLLILAVPFALRSGPIGKGAKIFSVTVSAFTFVYMLISSSMLTWQMVKLRIQIRGDYIRTTALQGTTHGSQSGDMELFSTNVQSATLGSTVLGLTWASTVAMLMETGLWAWSWMTSRREVKPVDMKEERYVEG